MIRLLSGLLLLGSVAVFSTGCGNVCDDAADICADEAGGEAEDGGDVECEGATECAANCIVDNDSCSSEATLECLAGC